MLIVRANALDSGETDSDLDAVMPGAPDAILLPGSLGRRASNSFPPSSRCARPSLGSRQRDPDHRRGRFGPVSIHIGSYRGPARGSWVSPGAPEALRADIEAEKDRDRLGDALGPYRLARELTLLAATSARVAAIDTAFPTSATWRACAPRRSPRDRTVLPARSRSIRPRSESSTTLPLRSAPAKGRPS